MTFSLERRLIAAMVAVALWAAGAALMASPVSAGSAQLNVDPTTVAAGEQITVSESCRMSNVDVGVYSGWLGPYVDPTTDPIVEQTGITPDAGDQWSVQLTIPEDTAPGSYTVSGVCSDGAPKGELFRYAAVELTVLPAPTPSTTVAPTTTLATTTTVAPPTPGPSAAPATAVKQAPTYTG